MSKRLRITLAAVVVVLAGAGVAVWYFVLRDTAPPEASLDAVGGSDGDASGGGPGSADGTWKIEADNSVFVGYRVQEMPSVPAKGKAVEMTVSGDLTLHGVTEPVDVAVEARWNGPTISVAGHTPVSFADFGMSSIEIPGFVSTDDKGTLELQLLFVPS